MTGPLDAPGVTLRASDLIALRRLALERQVPPPVAALPGGFVTRRRGHGQEIADVREYVAGDDIRHLDRGSTARTGVLHIRSFQEERDRVTILVADFRPAMLWGLSRAFLSVAAAEALVLIGWRAVEEGGRVGLLALGAGEPVALAPRGRTRGMLQVIGGLVRAHEAALGLALAGEREDPPFDAGFQRIERIAPAGCEIIIASGFDAAGEGLPDRLAALSQRRVPRLLAMTEGATRRLPPGSYPIRLADGRRRRLRISGPADTPPETLAIAGQQALVIDAGAPLSETALRLAGAFPPDRTP
ncbi:Protein of unknown function DUF58 [Poseidonocella pacifica]|uniref:DUF58 domain-containing protein n=1 Tax=Poseidonocella pacifica TaxID=871651 RepID=A0A1I0YHG6_9RHOB|nr:DUF58 domain-containing protein [Poseidonocella pacifica]SFB12186.1 Protein of unknown function DUF58 [Poseidonocella pacifica]